MTDARSCLAVRWLADTGVRLTLVCVVQHCHGRHASSFKIASKRHQSDGRRAIQFGSWLVTSLRLTLVCVAQRACSFQLGSSLMTCVHLALPCMVQHCHGRPARACWSSSSRMRASKPRVLTDARSSLAVLWWPDCVLLLRAWSSTAMVDAPARHLQACDL